MQKACTLSLDGNVMNGRHLCLSMRKSQNRWVIIRHDTVMSVTHCFITGRTEVHA